MTLHPRHEIYSTKGGMVPLTEAELWKMAPSIFSVSPHESRSIRYAHIETASIVESLRSEGFLPFAAKQNKARIVEKRNFVKHMIRFRRPEWVEGDLAVGAAIPEVVLINSHDGSSAYQLMAGLFRLVCTNGLIIADRSVGAVHVRHGGDVIPQVIAGAERILKDVDQVVIAQKSWTALPMSSDDQTEFAIAAHRIRWNPEHYPNPGSINPGELLNSRRPEDQKSDLWTVFNRVQENAIRGGISGYRPDQHTARGFMAGRRITSKEVKNIDQDMKLNKALWSLAEKTALKLAA